MACLVTHINSHAIHAIAVQLEQPAGYSPAHKCVHYASIWKPWKPGREMARKETKKQPGKAARWQTAENGGTCAAAVLYGRRNAVATDDVRTVERRAAAADTSVAANLDAERNIPRVQP